MRFRRRSKTGRRNGARRVVWGRGGVVGGGLGMAWMVPAAVCSRDRSGRRGGVWQIGTGVSVPAAARLPVPAFEG